MCAPPQGCALTKAWIHQAGGHCWGCRLVLLPSWPLSLAASSSWCWWGSELGVAGAPANLKLAWIQTPGTRTTQQRLPRCTMCSIFEGFCGAWRCHCALQARKGLYWAMRDSGHEQVRSDWLGQHAPGPMGTDLSTLHPGLVETGLKTWAWQKHSDTLERSLYWWLWDCLGVSDAQLPIWQVLSKPLH